jgi:hypothetical protein
MDPTKTSRVLYVNYTDTVVLACDACHRSQTVPAASLKGGPQLLKVRCPCGEVFTVTVVIRSSYRKPTWLPGTYATRDAQTGQMQIHGRMIVENLSRTGLGFRPLAPPSVRVNAVVQVTFTLDNPQQTLIQKAAQVRWIEGGFIGAAFLDPDAFTETNRILGFYLRPS